MILRLGVNFGAHLLAGLAFGALAACAASCMLRQRADRRADEELHVSDVGPDGEAPAPGGSPG